MLNPNSPNRRRFEFRIIPFVAMILVAAIGVRLGLWQLHRADEKHQALSLLQERTAAAPLDVQRVLAIQTGEAADAYTYRTVELRGRFKSQWTLYLDNRPLNGQAGMYLLSPFCVEQGPCVLVERGWFVRDAQDRTRVVKAPVTDQVIVLRGRIMHDAGHVMELGTPPALTPGAIVQNVSVEELAKFSQLPLLPFVIQQTSSLDDGLRRDWPQPGSGEGKHLGYAFQWFALAATAVVFFVVTGFRRGKGQT